jgi:pimeloyl-ACP methyl ester carboxylesterase
LAISEVGRILTTHEFEIPEPTDQFQELRRRVGQARWPAGLPADGWTAGTELATLQRLAERWGDGFDWSAQVAELNSLDHRMADIEGVRIHFVYFAPQHESTELPIILTHGWPSSFLELVGLARRLSCPSDFGRPPLEARPVVVPSLPGFGYSPARTTLAATPPTHELWHQLMSGVLGFSRYGAHGGDLGAGVTTRLAASHPEAIAGIHLLAPAWPDDVDPDSLTDEEREFLRVDASWDEGEGGYAHIQSTRPLTLSYGLADSPVGLLAWLVEKYQAWSDCEGDVSRRFSDDFLLTQATIYWLTNTIASSFRPYFEYRLGHERVGRITVPTGFAQFPHDLAAPPRSWLDRVYDDVTRHTVMPRGGHFAAHEEPDLLASEIAAFFANLPEAAQVSNPSAS